MPFYFSNIAGFKSDLEKHVDRLEKSLSVIVRKTALDGLRLAVKASPVDTGRFRAGWTVQEDTPSDWEPDDTAQKEARAEADAMGPTKKGKRRKAKTVYPRPRISDARGELASLMPYQAVWLSNQLPYGGPLNEGRSDQAEAGWFDAVVAAMGAEMQIAVAMVAGLERDLS